MCVCVCVCVKANKQVDFNNKHQTKSDQRKVTLYRNAGTTDSLIDKRNNDFYGRS